MFVYVKLKQLCKIINYLQLYYIYKLYTYLLYTDIIYKYNLT